MDVNYIKIMWIATLEVGGMGGDRVQKKHNHFLVQSCPEIILLNTDVLCLG